MPDVEIRVLGPLEVEVAGQAVELSSKKQRSLLAVLGLRAGEVVSTDRLVEELWGETAPKAAVGSLQNLVSALRKVLGPDLLVTRAPGYALEISPERIDVHRFERLADEARRSRPESAAAKLREALGLWRGPALADLAYEPFAQNEIARLEELRLAAREDLFEAELELGRQAQLVAEIEALIAEHPLRERLRGLLMLALYRSGRQAEALEAYRQARETLVEQLGIDPSAELQRLEAAILRQEPELDARARPRRAAPPPEPERRKTVTILFADIVDSAALGAHLDPEVLRGIMLRYFETVEAVVAQHGGTVEKFIGDAAMAVFGIPTQREDDALRAVRAANELRSAITELAAELTSERGIDLQLRIGVNTGEVLAGDPGSGQAFATGDAVAVAMRVQERAAPGEVFLGEMTYRLVRHAAETEPIEQGGAASLRVFRLVEVGDAIRPLGSASLIGREDELAWLREAFVRACEERRSRVVTVLGDAGVGKTRLVTELLAGLAEEASAFVGRCVSYGQGATYLPLAEIVRQAVPERPERTIASLLEGDEHAQLIAERVTALTGGAGGAASTGEVFWAVRRFLEALASRGPLVVVVEDAHWAEPTLLDLVEYLRAWEAEAPLLVVCLARPQLLEQRPGWKSDADALALDPLHTADATALVTELGGEELAEGARTRIVEVAEGNPLFLEQLFALAEDAGENALVSVPASIEALLAGRLDRLEPDERALLERAAVVGREFSRSAVVHLSPPDELAGLDTRLLTLIRRGLVHATRSEEEDAFRFHHALIRDVAYAGITKETRANIHERFAGWLEQRDGPDEIVGYHLEQAHLYRAELRPSDPELPALAKRAGDRLAAAGIRAWKHADTPATVNLLARAASLLAPGVPERAEILCELGIAQRALGDTAAGEATLTAAIEEAVSTSDRPSELRGRIELAYVRLVGGGEIAELVGLVAEATPVFEAIGNDRALGRAWRSLGYVRGAMEGQCSSWLVAADQALPHYRRSGWSTAGCVSDVVSALFYGPTPVPDAVERCQLLLEEESERLATAHVLVFLGGLNALAGQFDEASSALGSAGRIYEELGEPYELANSGWRIQGLAHQLAGEHDAAERVFRVCCETFEQAHDEAALSTVAAQLGQTLYAQGRYSEARELAFLAKKHAPIGDIVAQFSWRALLGKILARAGSVEQGEAIGLDALRIAEQTDVLTSRGEVLLDLAQILCSAGRKVDAVLRIEQALELFEEKGSTAPARAAGTLLAEVAAV